MLRCKNVDSRISKSRCQVIHRLLCLSQIFNLMFLALLKNIFGGACGGRERGPFARP